MPFENRGDFQVEMAGEFPISLVTSRNGHDRSCAVAGQNIVGDPDGHRRPGQWVQGVTTGEASGYSAVARHALPLAARGRFGLVCGHCILLFRGGNVGDELVLGGEHQEVRSIQCVGSCREDLHRLFGVVLDGKLELGSGRLSDPIALHFLDAVGPINAVEPGNQAVSIGGDPHHPLPHFFADHRVAAPLTASSDDLIVGEHSPERRAPIDLAVGEVGQAVGHQDITLTIVVEGNPLACREVPVKIPSPQCGPGRRQGFLSHGPIQARIALSLKVGHEVSDGRRLAGPIVIAMFKQAGKNPLGPAVIFRAAGAHLPRPIVAETEQVELLAVPCDVALCGDGRVLSSLNGILLCGEAKAVIPLWMQHIVALLALVAGDHIRGDISQGVTDVQSCTTGVRKHVQYIVLVLLQVFGDSVGALLLPMLAPLGFNGFEVVFHAHGM